VARRRHAPVCHPHNREKILNLRIIAALALLIPALGGAEAWTGVSTEGDLGLAVWGGMFQPSMYDMRAGVDSSNREISSNSWVGGTDSSSLTLGPQGGAEISWGVSPDVRILLSGEARGVSNKGSFKGKGANLGGNATNNLYLSCYGAEGGIAVLLREFEGGSRFSLTARAGVHALSGARISWSENGPAGEYSSTSRFSGTGLGALMGVEWEVFFSDHEGRNAPGMFILAGYRFLTFSRVDYRYHDSTGIKDAGAVRDSAGDRMPIDMGGPELRLGFQFVMPTKNLK
jgi:hypothetical protein